jgi:hypothetical protein
MCSAIASRRHRRLSQRSSTERGGPGEHLAAGVSGERPVVGEDGEPWKRLRIDSLTDQGLEDLIVELKAEEEGVSAAGGERNQRALDTPQAEVAYLLKVLRGKLDIVPGELVNRLRRENEDGEEPGAGSSGVRDPRRPTPQPGAGEISLPAEENARDDPCQPPDTAVTAAVLSHALA